MLVAGASTAWWFTTGPPAVQASDAQASAKASKAAAAKKKEDSDAFWAQVQAENAKLNEQGRKDAASIKASLAAERAAEEAGTSESIRIQMEAQGWTRFSGPYY